VVRECRDVDRNCRPSEGSAAGSGAHSARQGPGRLSGSDCRNVRRYESPQRTRRWNLRRVATPRRARRGRRFNVDSGQVGAPRIDTQGRGRAWPGLA
jgi:hypothetical protein